MDAFMRQFLTYFIAFIVPLGLLAVAALSETGGVLLIMASMVWIGVGVLFVGPLKDQSSS